MVPFAALLIASALSRPAVPETRQQIDKALPKAVARVVAYHRSGDVVVRTVAAGEEPVARLDLTVSGGDAKSESAKAEIKKAEQRFLESVSLSVTEEDGATTVRFVVPDSDRKPAKLSFNATLTLLLPEHSALVVDNSYGKVLVDGRVGNVKITNKFGAVEVDHVSGDVDVDDSFNTITVRHVTGDLVVTAKHCPVVAEGIGGLARIRTNACAVDVRGAGSADIETTNVSVVVRVIAHDVKVVAPFCSVTAAAIGGNLSIASGNFPVHVDDVDGDVSIQQSGGSIDVHWVNGKATVVGSRCDTTLEDALSGDVRCPWSVLRMVRVGSLIAENSSRTLEIQDPQGDVQATAAGGLLKLRATKLPAKDADDDPAHELTLVASEGGKIELKLPPDGSYALDATSTAGQLECALPGMDITLQGTARVGSLRRGGGKTKLHATSGGAISVAPAQ